MTRPSTLAIPGVEGALMRNALKPDAFADACRWIVETYSDEEAHRKLDILVTSLLTCLGFGEGMEIFIGYVSRHHASTPQAIAVSDTPAARLKGNL